jgi:hypothetical protein
MPKGIPPLVTSLARNKRLFARFIFMAAGLLDPGQLTLR